MHTSAPSSCDGRRATPPIWPRRARAAAIATVAMIAAIAGPVTRPGPAAAAAPLAAPLAAATTRTPAGPYAPPVPEPPSRLFDPPATPYGPGNRGLDYTTAPGEPVAAAAAGVVAFAGPVAGALHVVVRHPDGLRTSYSFLASVVVARGDSVAAGQTVGLSGGSFHFGVRAGTTYLDPRALFGGDGVRLARVHLVPDDGSPLPPADAERRGLVASLRGLPASAVRVGRAAVAWAASTPPAALGLSAAGAVELGAAVVVAEARSLGRDCTSARTATPVLTVRHLAVLVAGLGSATGEGAVFGFDTAAVGYRAVDVFRFSYRGGAPDQPDRYGSADTQVDLRTSARRLRALLGAIASSHPGVPVDVIAHSQGGLVALAALVEPPPVAAIVALVALGSPFHGADLATDLALVGHSATGAALEGETAKLPVAGGIRADSRAVHQLAQTSDFIRWLDRQPLPATVPVTSIAARGDLIVPSPRSWIDGATNVVVDVGGVSQHSSLPRSPAAEREVALAVTGHAPTCRSPVATALDAVAGEAITVEEQLAGVALAASTTAADLGASRG